MTPCSSGYLHRPRDRGFRLRLVALLVWAAALAVLSLLPGVPSPPGPFGWDKFQHFTAYAVLTLLLAAVLACRLTGRLPPALRAFAGGFAFGAAMEGLQWAMGAGRSAEWSDLLANSLGALTGSVLFCLGSGRFSSDRNDSNPSRDR